MANKHDIGITLSAKDKTRNAFRSVEQRVDSMVSGFSTAQRTVLGLVGVAGLGALAKSSLDTADAMAKAAEKTGFNTTTLQELRHAADLTGVSVSELDGGLARFTKRLGLARIGTGAAASTYEQLGIDLSKTNQEVFRDVVNTLGAMTDQTDRLALTTRLFGDDAQKLELTFRNGAAGLDKFAAEAHKLGLIMDERLLRNAEAANDQLSIMQRVVSTQLTTAMVELAPVITSIGNAFAAAAPHITSFVQQFGEMENMGIAALEAHLDRLGAQFESNMNQINRFDELLADPSRATAWEKFSSLFIEAPEDIDARLSAQNDVIYEKILAANARLEKLKAERAKRDKGGFGVINISGGQQDDKLQQEEQKYFDSLQRRLDAYQQSLMSERQLEQQHYLDQEVLIDEAFEEKLIGESRRDSMLEELELQHQAKLGNIVAQGALKRRKFMEMNARQQTQYVLGQAQAMTAGVAQQNKAMFRLNQAVGIANAIVNTAVGATRAIAEYPPPLSFAMAALQIAAGHLQVEAIRNAKFGSGTAPSIAATGASATVATVSADSQLPGVDAQSEKKTLSVQDIAEDEPYSAAAVRRLVEMIRDAQSEGWVLE